MRRIPLLATLALAAACAGPRTAREAAPAASPAAAPTATATASAASPAEAAPDGAPGASPWWKGAVFYEVFVRSFQDSNGDGKGDLRGLVSRLDALNDGDPRTTQDLGVDALWLMPVFESPSYHGYDVVDYERIERDYGTNADFDALLAEAHRRGMKVVVDLVLNHTSDAHPWFRESASSPSSPKRDWYVWSATDPGWTQPWSGNPSWHERNGAFYYGLFWGGMPDLNYRNPAVREEAKRIARFWLSRGVDGFRLDAIRHLIESGPGEGQARSPETHAFLKEFAAAVRAEKPDAVLVGEVWSTTDDIAPYYGARGDELDLLFDFPLATAIVGGVNAATADGVALALRELQDTYPPGAVDAPFLTNHDQIRVATQLAGDRAKEGLAAAVLLTLPGTPFVYYGEELGMPNGPGGEDEWKRTPMPWDASPGAGFTTGKPWMPFPPGVPGKVNVAAEAADPGALLARYRALIRARKGSEALARGDLALLAADPGGGGSVLAFLRRTRAETVLVVHNFGAEPTVAAGLAAPGAAAEPVFVDPGAALARDGAGWRASLPARATAVWRLR